MNDNSVQEVIYKLLRSIHQEIEQLYSFIGLNSYSRNQRRAQLVARASY